jgi:hypothetical protein
LTDHQLAFTVAGVLGGGPGFALLWYGLRTYDYPFVEKSLFNGSRVFFALAIGLVVGTVSAAFSTLAFGLDLVSGLAILGLVAVFDEGFKLIYLNRKGYRTRFDTTFYGLALGVGMGIPIAMASVYLTAQVSLAAVPLLLLFAFAVGVNLIHAFTGSLIGFGCAEGDAWPRFGAALAVRAAFLLVALPFTVPGRVDYAFSVIALVLAVAFALLLFRYAYSGLLPNTLPADLRRLRRRGMRRLAQGKDQTAR